MAENEKKTKRNPVAGIMAGDIMQDYSKYLGTYISQSLVAAGFEVRLFLGCDPTEFLPEKTVTDRSLKYHYYSMYEYSRYDDLDIIVLMNRSLNASPIAFHLEEFMGMIPEVPVIFVGEAKEHERAVHVLTGHYPAFRKMIRHLVKEHGYQKLVCIAGPKGSYEADECRRAYADERKELGISYHMELELAGDFYVRAEAEIEKFWVSHPEAEGFVCANDFMAEAVYKVADRMGYVVGEDIAVTGFDNIAAAKYMSPPLTTAEQELQKIAEAVKIQAEHIIRGETPEDIVLEAPCRIRQSCGCMKSWTGRYGKTEDQAEDLIQWQKGKIMDLKLQSMFCSMLLRNLLLENLDEEMFYSLLGRQMQAIGILRTYLFLHQKPIPVKAGKKAVLPDSIYLFLVQEGKKIRAWKKETAPLVARSGIADYVGTETPVQLLQFLLFFREEQYGIMLLEVDPSNEKVPFCHTISLEIGSTLRYLQMTLERNRVQLLLKERNKVLDYAATHDELTGLYNRAGILGKAAFYFSEYSEEDSFVIVIADMDHLKQIYDTFGHMEGDAAIISTAEILKRSLPEGSLIGRSGGDEYICLFHLEEERQPEEVRERIRRECESFNR
ncbi:MAG: GGDEF domain-containing protein, partial [Lachnospiraceae bacterium]|nr:GGDEF domain-containing protein [Lachnospiraceae bacterium]